MIDHRISSSRVSSRIGLHWIHMPFLLIAFFTCTAHLTAQLLPHAFRRLTVEDGLPSNNMSDVLQDSRHYLWIGTINGLCRYNGREFEQFVDDPTLKNRLKGDFVRSLYEDKAGFIYVLNHGGGLHRYDYHHPELGFQQLIPATAFPKFKGMGISSFILYADQKETYIFYDDTIRRYDFITQKMSNYDPFEQDPEYGGFKIKSYKPIPYTGNIVVGFHRKLGLIAFNIKSGEAVFKLPASVQKEMAALQGLNRFNVIMPYLLVLGEYGRFWMFDWKKQQLLYNGNLALPEGARILTGGPLLDGSFIYTYDRVTFYKYNPDLRSARDMKYLLVREDTFATTIRGVMVTRDGHTWVGTNEGLIQWDINRQTIDNYQVRIKNFPYTTLPNVTSFTKTPDQQLLIGTMGGIHMYDEQDGQFQIFPTERNEYGEVSKGVVFGDENKTYVAYHGLKEVDIQRNVIRTLTLHGDQAAIDSFEKASVISILKDTIGPKPFWWIGTGSKGLFQFDPQNNFLEHVQIIKNNALPGEVEINSMALHSSGQLLMCCRKTGLYMLDRQTKKIELSIPYDPEGAKALFNGTVVFMQVNKDVFWLVEQSVGLVRLNMENPSQPDIKVFGKESGLNNTLLYSGQIDQKGNVWISSQSGIEKWDIAHQRFFHFGPEQGIVENQFRGPSWTDKNGRMYFAAVHSFISFHPDSLHLNEKPPTIFLKSVQVNANDRPDLLEEEFFHLKHFEKNLLLRFDAIEFDNPKKVLFRYKFFEDGEEDIPYTITDRLEMTLPNLSPGTYEIVYNSCNEHGFWNAEDRKLTIHIPVAWYASAWFLALCVLSITGILYALYRYRIRQLKRILILRNRISRDLHDDIGSTLGSISVYSEVAKNVTAENRTDVLDKIGEASREMIEKLNDLVWSINAENDTLEKMEKRMRSYAAMLLNPLGIAFDLQLKADEVATHLNMDHRKNIFLIFKEALHNAAKYSHCKLVTILLEEDRGQLRLEIRDDGVGFDPSLLKAHNGNGLTSMRERAKAIDASMIVESHPGQGTRIYLVRK